MSTSKPARKRIRTVEGSCWKCKDRRVKCDLKQPCTKCLLGNFECSYGKRIRYQLFKPQQTLERAAIRTEPKLELQLQEIPPASSNMFIVRRDPSMPFTTDLKMMYFERILSPKLTMYGGSISFENSTIFRDPVLSSFIEAVSTAHRMVGSCDDSTLDVVNSSRTSLINGFRQKIIDFSKTNMNVLFAGSVFLCLLDGVIYPKEGSKIAYTHLQGGRAILKQMGTPQILLTTLSDPISIMMLSYFGTIDLTNCILTGTYPYFGKDFWISFGGKEGWWGNISSDDPFLEILGTFADVARLVLETSNVPLSRLLLIQSFFDRRVKIGKPSSDSWDVFCSIFSFAGLIYIYRVIGGFREDDELIQNVVKDCFDNIVFLKDDMLQHCLLFPLLIVGYHCLELGQQEILRQSVAKSYSHLTFGSVRILQTFLEQKWIQNPTLKTWLEDFELVSETVFLF